MQRELHEQFDFAVAALASELGCQTTDEAKDVSSFLTLLRVHLRKTEDAWASTQPEEALHGLRQIATIAVQAMIYNGIRFRPDDCGTGLQTRHNNRK